MQGKWLRISFNIESVTKKIKRAYSGGQSTIEEHRRLGGNPDVDVAYQYMMYFFEDDDDFLHSINSDYRAGKILAGEMKQLCIDRAAEWLEELNENTCKYMEGHPNESSASFCGRKTVEKFSYCPLHLIVVFQPRGKKEDLNEEDEIPQFIEKKIKSA